MKEYNIIAYSWIRDGCKNFEMDIYEGSSESFLEEVKDDSEIYEIHVVAPITKDSYDKILGEMTCPINKP